MGHKIEFDRGDRVFFILMAVPILCIGLWLLIEFTIAAGKVWDSMMQGGVGLILLTISAFILLFYYYKFIIIRFLFSLAVLGASIVVFIAFVAVGGKVMQLLFFIAVYETVFAFYQLKNIYNALFGELIEKRGFHKKIRKKKGSEALKEISREIKEMGVEQFKGLAGATRKSPLVFFTMLIIICGGVLTPRLYFPDEIQKITITDQRAQSYNLVVYFPDYTAIDDQIAEIFLEANATLSFPLRIDNFDENDTNGIIAAQKVAFLNQKGVPVEIWPLFNYDNGSYPSLSEIDDWDYLYNMFQQWVERNNITVEYILWDIEAQGEGGDVPSFDDWPSGLQGFARAAYSPVRIKDIDERWEQALSVIHSISQRARDDGHKMITTTHTIIPDVLDGDADVQKLWGLPVWAAGDDFNYISMMAYRGCEGGGMPRPPAYVYEYVHISSVTSSGDVAICLGCINYTPYPTIEDVKDDVLLALGAGATTVRIFQANSWINGVGTYQISGDNWVYGGIAHGIDNNETEGLRQLLHELRTGGSVTFIPDRNVRGEIVLSIFQDVMWDIEKV